MSGDSASSENLRRLINKKRYGFHITTRRNAENILQKGALSTRRGLSGNLGEYQDVANNDLIVKRASFLLPGGPSLDYTVPFYLTPRQPMFSRIVRLGHLQSSDVVALIVDLDKYAKSRRHWLFDTNPVYGGAQYLGGWKNKLLLDWTSLENWNWTEDADSGDRPRTWKRQAEVCVLGSIEVTQISGIVVGHAETLAQERRVNRILISGVFDPQEPLRPGV